MDRQTAEEMREGDRTPTRVHTNFTKCSVKQIGSLRIPDWGGVCAKEYNLTEWQTSRGQGEHR